MCKFFDNDVGNFYYEDMKIYVYIVYCYNFDVVKRNVLLLNYFFEKLY